MVPRVFFLKENEQIYVEGVTKRWVKNGPGTYWVPPFAKVKKFDAITLTSAEYIRIEDTLSGEIRIVSGPTMFFLGVNEVAKDRALIHVLKHNEYLKLLDKSSGKIRLEIGECTVVPGPFEVMLEGPRPGISIDEKTAVQVRNTKTGELSVVTEKQVFFPKEDQEVVGIVERVSLEPHDSAIVRDKDGRLRIAEGRSGATSFFLDPYEELLVLKWSSGIHKDQRSLEVRKLDSRPKFMWYEFEVRTRDNVELVIGITFFWQLENVAKMIASTDDAPGDVCSHSRSLIIQAISKVSLENFLNAFNDIVKNAVLVDSDTFCSDRGVRVHSIEVRSVVCKEASTQAILQEIIQETTNRLNRIQKQDSENEIEINKVKGRIEAERNKAALIEIESQNKKREAEIQGTAESARVKAFLDGLGTDVTLSEKIRMYELLKKDDYIEKLSKGNARMYFTPSDVNLSIETKDS